MIKWEKVKAEEKVEVKAVNPAKQATLQEKDAITLLQKRVNNSWKIKIFFPLITSYGYQHYLPKTPILPNKEIMEVCVSS